MQSKKNSDNYNDINLVNEKDGRKANVLEVANDEQLQSRYELRKQTNRRTIKLWPALLIALPLVLLFALNMYTKSLIVIEKPKQNYGEKIVIHLPTGKTVYTYENFIIYEDDKIFYEGERNKIDLTEGEIVYENWE